MNGVALPIMIHTDSTKQFEELGIDVKDEDCATKEFTFYQIALISPRIANKDHTIVSANGDFYICTLRYSEVKELIKKHL